MTLLAETAAAWGLALTEAQLGQFARYAELLREWNERVNLTAITDPTEIERRHFLDSLACAFAWDGPPPESLIDIGTGAGFPGLPLKILWPQARLTLVESIGKKTAFLQHVAGELGLTDVMVLTMRAEAIGHERAHRERYDLALARAVATLPVLAEYCLPLVRVGGRFLAPKGSGIDAEVAGGRRAAPLLGAELTQVFDVEIPGLDPRLLVVFEKRSPTPADLPRQTGVPSRKPLG